MNKTNTLRIVCRVMLCVFFFGALVTTRLLAATSKQSIQQKEQLTSLFLSADTSLVEGQPNHTYGSNSFLQLGYDPVDMREYDLLLFNLDNIPSESVIVSSSLKLYLAGWTLNDQSINVQASELIGNWNENITWNEFNQKIANNSLHIDETDSQTISIPAQPGFYFWSVGKIVQSCIDRATPCSSIGFILRGVGISGKHERFFWSKDCSDADCGVLGSENDKRPKLEIQFVPPPTVKLTLSNKPTGRISTTDTITYTIHYEYVSGSGGIDLTNSVVTNTIPSDYKLVPGSITGGSNQQGNAIVWKLPSPLKPGNSGDISYVVSYVGDPNSKNIVAYNQGATMTWDYDFRKGMRAISNGTASFSNPKYVYLPLVRR